MRLRKISVVSLRSCLIVIGMLLHVQPSIAQTEGSLQLSIDTSGQHLVREEIILKVTLLHRAILHRDSIRLDEFLDNDISYIHSNGLTQSKAEMIRSVVSRQHDYRKINPRNIDVKLIGQGALVTMDADVSLFLDGKPLELDLKITQIWMKDELGHWKLVSRQSNRNG